MSGVPAKENILDANESVSSGEPAGVPRSEADVDLESGGDTVRAPSPVNAPPPRPTLRRFLSGDRDQAPPVRPLRETLSMRLSRNLSDMEVEAPEHTLIAKLLDMGFEQQQIEAALRLGSTTVEEAAHAIFESAAAPDAAAAAEAVLPEEFRDPAFVREQSRMLARAQSGRAPRGSVGALAARGQSARLSPARRASAARRSAAGAILFRDSDSESGGKGAAAETGETVECVICMDDIPVALMRKAECGHDFCSDCWEGYLSTHIRDADVLDLKCPQEDCEREVKDDEIKGKVTSATFAKYKRFLKAAQLQANPRARWCPSKDCETCVVHPAMSLTSRVHCPQCENDFCYKCNEPWHAGMTCNKAQDQLFLQHKKDNHITPCPGCGAPTFKTDGCNHMTCSRCKYNYCYICGAWNAGGLHFANLNIFGCPGKQFSNDVPMPPCRARCKRWFSNVMVVFVILIMLAIAISALLQPLTCCCCLCVVFMTGCSNLLDD